MAKITLANGMVIEGTAEELTALAQAFNADDAEVEADEKPKYKTVKRHAKVGERILIVNADSAGGRYSNGDVLTVVKEYGKTGASDLVQAEGVSIGIYDNEYEVIVEEADKPASEITYKGETYALVSRKAQPGDVVVFTENTSPYFTNGQAYGPVVLNGKHTEIKDNYGDYLYVYFTGYGRTEANTLVYAPKEQPLRVGDFVKPLPSADVDYIITNSDMKLGKVVGIVEGRRLSDISVDIVAHADESEVGGEFDVEAKHFRKATAEEVAEATKPKFTEGDFVKTLARSKYGSIGAGAIVKVGEVRKDGSIVVIPISDNEANGIYQPHDLEPIDAKDAVFVKIGRKPNEFKKGDIVRGERTMNRGEFVTGEVVDATQDSHGHIGVRTFNTDDFRSVFAHSAELIAPVESRVDTK